MIIRWDHRQVMFGAWPEEFISCLTSASARDKHITGLATTASSANGSGEHQITPIDSSLPLIAIQVVMLSHRLEHDLFRFVIESSACV